MQMTYHDGSMIVFNSSEIVLALLVGDASRVFCTSQMICASCGRVKSPQDWYQSELVVRNRQHSIGSRVGSILLTPIVIIDYELCYQLRDQRQGRTGNAQKQRMDRKKQSWMRVDAHYCDHVDVVVSLRAVPPIFMEMAHSAQLSQLFLSGKLLGPATNPSVISCLTDPISKNKTLIPYPKPFLAYPNAKYNLYPEIIRIPMPCSSLLGPEISSPSHMRFRPISLHQSLILSPRILPIVRPLRERHQNGGDRCFFHPYFFFILRGRVFVVQKLQEVLFVHLDEKRPREEEQITIPLRHPYFLLLLQKAKLEGIHPKK